MTPDETTNAGGTWKFGDRSTCRSCGEEIEYVGPYWRHVNCTPRHFAVPRDTTNAGAGKVPGKVPWLSAEEKAVYRERAEYHEEHNWHMAVPARDFLALLDELAAATREREGILQVWREVVAGLSMGGRGGVIFANKAFLRLKDAFGALASAPRPATAGELPTTTKLSQGSHKAGGNPEDIGVPPPVRSFHVDAVIERGKVIDPMPYEPTGGAGEQT